MHSKLLWTQTLDINPGKVSLRAYKLPDARGFWPVATVGGAQELKCLTYLILYHNETRPAALFFMLKCFNAPCSETIIPNFINLTSLHF